LFKGLLRGIVLYEGYRFVQVSGEKGRRLCDVMLLEVLDAVSQQI
jgi:hypothetical protein